MATKQADADQAGKDLEALVKGKEAGDTSSKSKSKSSDKLTLDNIAGLPTRAISDDTVEKFKTWLIYGDSGVGKTTLGASSIEVPELTPLIHLDIEDGTESLRGLYDDPDLIRTVPIRSIRDLEKVAAYLHTGDHPFKTVMVDNITETQQFGIVEIMAAEGKSDPDKKLNTGFENPDAPELKHYNKSTEQVRRIIRGFRNLPMHTIIIAHENVDQVKDKQGNVRKSTTRPALTNKASKAAPGYVDEVLYMYLKVQKGVTKRYLLCNKLDDVIAKDRSRKLPQVLEEPTMKMIYDLMTGKTVIEGE